VVTIQFLIIIAFYEGLVAGGAILLIVVLCVITIKFSKEVVAMEILINILNILFEDTLKSFIDYMHFGATTQLQLLLENT